MLRFFSIVCFCVLLLTTPFPSTSYAYTIDDSKDSDELIIYDSLMVFLGDPIEKAVSNYYLKTLTESPRVDLYDIKMLHLERPDGFRSFTFKLTVEVQPFVGPHISVGKDQLTLEVSPIIPHYVKVDHYHHVITYELPPNWQHMIRP